jgi:DNA-binding IclR family transcriptional regulator
VAKVQKNNRNIAAPGPDAVDAAAQLAYAAEVPLLQKTMARSSPGVHRVAAILNFFAEHTGQAFTLTEVVRSLKISRATCHTLLTGLVEVGYLHRMNGKSYVVGPVLVGIARTISAHHSPLQVGQPEMRALADEFDAVCSAVFREGNDVVVRDRAASVSNLGWSLPLGARMPLRPPYAATFFAWSPKAEVDAWLAAHDPTPSAELRAHMFEAMLFRREYGFTFVINTSDEPAADRGMDFIYRGDTDNAPARVMTQLDPEGSYRLSSISAPVFESQNKIAFELVLTSIAAYGPNPQVSGAEVLRLGRRLRDACERISAFVSPAAVAA